jgi:prophage regulatory protein
MTKYPKIIRKAAVLKRYPVGTTTLYKQINQGIFPPNVAMGSRLVGWIESEVDAVIAAIARGINEPSLKQLVAELVAKRNEPSGT